MEKPACDTSTLQHRSVAGFSVPRGIIKHFAKPYRARMGQCGMDSLMQPLATCETAASYEPHTRQPTFR
jgi:hypothetical protein